MFHNVLLQVSFLERWLCTWRMNCVVRLYQPYLYGSLSSKYGPKRLKCLLKHRGMQLDQSHVVRALPSAKGWLLGPGVGLVHDDHGGWLGVGVGVSYIFLCGLMKVGFISRLINHLCHFINGWYVKL